MDDEVLILFDKEFITIQSNSFIRKFPNLMAIHPETNKIVSVGETEEEISSFNPKKWAEEKHQVIFQSIYDSSQFNCDDISLSMFLLLLRVYKHKKHFKKLTCKLEIPRYELVKENKEYFEYTV